VLVSIAVLTLGISSGCKRTSSRSVSSKLAPSDAGALNDARPPLNGDAALAQEGVEKELRSIAQCWNDALAQRNASMLETVYGARIRLLTQLSLQQSLAQAVCGRALGSAPHSEACPGSLPVVREEFNPASARARRDRVSPSEPPFAPPSGAGTVCVTDSDCV
jgi:hypothetical protein